MTLKQARELYIFAGGPDDHSETEWKQIRQEMIGLVVAPNEREAGRSILWWDSWPNPYTRSATAFARKVRQRWREIKDAKN